MKLRLLVDREGPNPRYNPRLPASKDNPHTIALPKGTEITVSEQDGADLLAIRIPADPDYEPEGEPVTTMPIVELVPAKPAVDAK